MYIDKNDIDKKQSLQQTSVKTLSGEIIANSHPGQTGQAGVKTDQFEENQCFLKKCILSLYGGVAFPDNCKID